MNIKSTNKILDKKYNYEQLYQQVKEKQYKQKEIINKLTLKSYTRKVLSTTQ